ncbi:MAG: methyl-accepting chemotaxis protein, partial [Pseudomonadota bacterium]
QNTLGPVAMVTANRSIWVVGAIVFFGLMLGALLAFGTGRFLSRKINALTESMIGLADGNLDVPMPSTKGKDEIARMTKSMGVFAANARKARDLDAEIKRKTAEDQKRAAEDRARDADAQAAQQAADARDRAAAQARLDTMEQFQAEMEDVLDRAASGDFSRRMSAETEDPALQGVARAVNRLLEATETNIDDMVRSIGALAEGNLTTRIDGTRDGAFARMQADFNDALAALSQTLAQITQTGHSVSSTAAELESSSTGMAKRAEQTAAAVEETSAAVAQITESIRQVVQNANAANDATHKVRDSAERSRAVSDKTEAAISSMMEASGQIDRVVKVIEDIAFQINLLALNAGIEAARAGDAGRGFSVVASEVRALSLRSHDAVQSITAVIETNTQSVQAGVEQVHLSRRAIETIVSEVELASQQIGDIAEAVENQSQSIEEVNGAIRSIDASAQANAAALEEMTMSSASLRGEAMALSDALTQFEASPQAETPPPARRAS